MPYELTSMDISAIRKADFLSINLDTGKPSVRAIKRNEKTAKDPFAQDIEHSIGSDVTISWNSHAINYRSEARCHALLWLYRDQHTHATSVLGTLRAGDEAIFMFYPDGGTTGNMAPLGLHSDILYLVVLRKGKQVAKFELSHSVCPNNSARMCCGIPDSDSYKVDAEHYGKLRIA